MREALAEVGITGMTVTGSERFGRQKGHTELYRGAEYMVDFLPKVKIEIVATDDIVDTCVDTIIRTWRRPAKSATVRSLSLDVARVIRIRTGERRRGDLSCQTGWRSGNFRAAYIYRSVYSTFAGRSICNECCLLLIPFRPAASAANCINATGPQR